MDVPDFGGTKEKQGKSISFYTEPAGTLAHVAVAFTVNFEEN